MKTKILKSRILVKEKNNGDKLYYPQILRTSLIETKTIVKEGIVFVNLFIPIVILFFGVKFDFFNEFFKDMFSMASALGLFVALGYVIHWIDFLFINRYENLKSEGLENLLLANRLIKHEEDIYIDKIKKKERDKKIKRDYKIKKKSVFSERDYNVIFPPTEEHEIVSVSVTKYKEPRKPFDGDKDSEHLNYGIARCSMCRKLLKDCECYAMLD